jgi:hypothetical protein
LVKNRKKCPFELAKGSVSSKSCPKTLLGVPGPRKKNFFFWSKNGPRPSFDPSTVVLGPARWFSNQKKKFPKKKFLTKKSHRTGIEPTTSPPKTTLLTTTLPGLDHPTTKNRLPPADQILTNKFVPEKNQILKPPKVSDT